MQFDLFWHLPQICLEKVQERWWEALLEGEEQISVREIDASRPMTDLDDEAQSKIQEMMYNEQQKRLGKPQSHEQVGFLKISSDLNIVLTSVWFQKVHDMLKQAWDAEGSPFKGQPFDPSKLNVTKQGSTFDVQP